MGAVPVGLWFSRRPPQRHAGLLLLTDVAGFGVCIIGFACRVPMAVGWIADASGPATAYRW